MEGRYGQDLSAYEKYLTEKKDCIVCGSSDYVLWTKIRPFKAVQCSVCGFVWINPAPTREGLENYYNNHFEKRMGQTEKAEQRQLQYEVDRNFLELFVSKGRLLDIGCSGGYFLDTLSNNFEKHGIDIDPEAVRYANENYNFMVTQERIEEYHNTRFDVITMRGVVEHFPNPVEVMEKVASLLKKGGVLYLAATPDVSSFCADLYREKWNQFHPIQHLSYFSVPTLTRFLSNNFEYVAHHHPYIETPYQDIENDYRLVKKACKGKKGISPAFWGNMMNVVYRRL